MSVIGLDKCLAELAPQLIQSKIGTFVESVENRLTLFLVEIASTGVRGKMTYAMPYWKFGQQFASQGRLLPKFLCPNSEMEFGENYN